MSFTAFKTGKKSELSSQRDLSSFDESGIETDNLTMHCYEDQVSHEISAFPVESDIFDISEIRTYETPVDSAPMPSLSKKEVQSLKKKFEEFKSLKKVPSSKSPRPIIKSPLNKKIPNASPLTPINTQPSYKKPLITLKVQILGKEVTENLYHGDYSIDVAKKVFAKVSSSPSQADLKALAGVIEENVQKYILEVSAELARFNKNSKKIEENNTKKKLEKIKPPLLLTERRADEKKQVLGTVSLALDGTEIVFTVKEGENPAKVAEKVCEKQGVNRSHLLEIVKKVKELQDRSNKKFLFRLEFEVNGKVAELALYEGDNLTVAAQKFCREHKLGGEYVAKIEDVLHKHASSVA